MNKKLKSIIHVIRHGARTSSSIGRVEDFDLAVSRKGITPFGLFQFFKLGQELRNKEESHLLFEECYSGGEVNIITSDKSRTLDSARGLLLGFEYNDSTDYNVSYSLNEENFHENILDCHKFDKNIKYKYVLEKFKFLEKFKNQSKNKVIINKEIFNKSITEDFSNLLKNRSKEFELRFNIERENKILKDFFNKLFLDELSPGIYDFLENKFIDVEYLKSKSDNLKRYIDFIKCNKFYEDIPLYKKEYEEIVFILKRYLVNHYHHSSTVLENINLIRLKNFLNEFNKIVESNKSSVHIFINHNTAIRTLLQSLIDSTIYNEFLTNPSLVDKNFFIIAPKFAAHYTFKIYSDNTIQLEANNENITNILKKEFIEVSNGEYFINFHNFKEYFNR